MSNIQILPEYGTIRSMELLDYPVVNMLTLVYWKCIVMVDGVLSVMIPLIVLKLPQLVGN